MKKNEEYIVYIIDNGFEGEGIAKIDNFTIFIPGAIKGEKVKVVIVKVTSSFAYGKILEILGKSEYRVEDVDCGTYKRCGGCNLRHINYSKTLELKKNTVQNLVNKTLKEKIEVKDTIGMDNPFNYRNKAQYPVGLDKKGNPVVGVFANRTHEVIEIKECMIQNKESEKIAKYICEFAKENNIDVYSSIGNISDVDITTYPTTENLIEIYENVDTKKYTFDYKMLNFLMLRCNIKLEGVIFDLLISSYLINPEYACDDFKIVVEKFEFDNDLFLSKNTNRDDIKFMEAFSKKTQKRWPF